MKIRGTALPAIYTFEFVDDKLILRLGELIYPIGRLLGVMKLKYRSVAKKWIDSSIRQLFTNVFCPVPSTTPEDPYKKWGKFFNLPAVLSRDQGI